MSVNKLLMQLILIY